VILAAIHIDEIAEPATEREQFAAAS